MERGRIAADGPTPAVLTAGNIRRIFEVDAQVCAAPDGRTWIRYGP
jgi:ABC-type cobalamin/Fe3+-siderophores transport system ATPase subunit